MLRAAGTFAGQAVGGDAWQRLPTHVAESGPGVRAGVPVVHPREMLHVELARLVEESRGSDGVKATLFRREGAQMETRRGH